MSHERHSIAQGGSSNHHHHCHKCHSSKPAPPGEGLLAKAKWGWQWFWHLVFRNRIALFIASLFWLLYRSGTQPRRLTYPCQQVAAVNVGAFLAALIPTSLLLRKYKGGVAIPKRVVMRRQLIAAGIMCLVGVIGIETYEYADTLLQTAATLPNVPAPAVEPPPALVGIAHRPYPSWHYNDPVPTRPRFTAAEIDEMVERAITLAGGLDQIMVDKNQDDLLDIVIKPNLVTDISNTAYPENGITTDPRVMASVVRLVKEAADRVGFTGSGRSVRIVEGSASGFQWPGGNTSRNITKTAFINCGYTTDPVTGQQWFTYDPSVELVDLNDSGGLDQFDSAKVTQVTIGNALCRQHYWVPNVVLNSDVFINVAPLKNHGNADMTCSMKCQGIGCAPSDIYHARSQYGAGHEEQMKLALHYLDIPGLNAWDPGTDPGWDYPSYPSGDSNEIQNLVVNYTVVDMNLFRPMDFAVIDGLVGITNGPADWPSSQISPNMQCIMAGKDFVALDTVAGLSMGYDPDYVRYLRWAYNRELGTMNTGNITVLGDHVALWRQYFGSRANSSPCDLTAPTLFGISTPEAAAIVGGDKVTLNGFTDTKGPVVRAEAAVAILGPDLLTNGDFENGSAGWTTWRAPWGTNEVWDFNNTNVSSMGDQHCLRLGGTSTNSSFGVYQQVAVTPGKTYRLDGQWKGTRLGDSNWWEVVLVDGPYDYDQADNGPIVETNYMFAYDNVCYGFPGGIGVGFGWLWTHDQYAPPQRQVDWNNRLGRRKATGNTMTVILKAGSVSTGGVEAYFDNITLREVGEDNIVAAVSNPTSNAQLELDFSQLPPGTYPGELRTTIYDKALNEDSAYRNVTVQTCPQNPWVCVNTNSLAHELFVSDPPAADTVEVWNCGCLGGDVNYDISVDVPWIHVDPTDGMSPANPPTTNLHSVWYDSLPPGVHTGVITVTGPYNVQEINVTVTVNTVGPDLDLDGDVDQADFGMLQACYTGTTQVAGACTPMDLNGDTYVNSADLAILKGCLAGSDIYPAADCEN